MKGYMLLIILIITSYTGFSQDSAPKTQLTLEVLYRNEDTVFCFSLIQAKRMALLLESGRYEGMLHDRQKMQNTFLEQVIDQKDSTIALLRQRVMHDALIKQNSIQATSQLTRNLQATRQQVKRAKRQNIYWQVGLGLVTLLSVLR